MAIDLDGMPAGLASGMGKTPSPPLKRRDIGDLIKGEKHWRLIERIENRSSKKHSKTGGYNLRIEKKTQKGFFMA